MDRWGGPKRENRREGDGTSKCYRWLAKDDLMTKTGYGYAKCLTVAGTATPLLAQIQYPFSIGAAALSGEIKYTFLIGAAAPSSDSIPLCNRSSRSLR